VPCRIPRRKSLKAIAYPISPQWNQRVSLVVQCALVFLLEGEREVKHKVAGRDAEGKPRAFASRSNQMRPVVFWSEASLVCLRARARS
jgi:hypothetical protein